MSGDLMRPVKKSKSRFRRTQNVLVPPSQTSFPPAQFPHPVAATCLPDQAPEQPPVYPQNLPGGLPSDHPAYKQQECCPGGVMQLQYYLIPPPPQFQTPTLPVTSNNLQFGNQYMPMVSLPLAPPGRPFQPNYPTPSQNIPDASHYPTTRPGASLSPNLPGVSSQVPTAYERFAISPMRPTAQVPSLSGWPGFTPKSASPCQFGTYHPPDPMANWNIPYVEAGSGTAEAPRPAGPPMEYSRPHFRRPFYGEVNPPALSPENPPHSTPSHRATAPVKPVAVRAPAVDLAEIDPLVMTSIQHYMLRVVSDKMTKSVRENLNRKFYRGCSDRQFRLVREWEARLEAVKRDISAYDEEKSRLERELQNVADRLKATLYGFNLDWNSESTLRDKLFDINRERRKYMNDKLVCYLLDVAFYLKLG